VTTPTHSLKGWIDVGIYVNIWNEESKDVYRDTVLNRLITIPHCLNRKGEYQGKLIVY